MKVTEHTYTFRSEAVEIVVDSSVAMRVENSAPIMIPFHALKEARDLLDVVIADSDVAPLLDAPIDVEPEVEP